MKILNKIIKTIKNPTLIIVFLNNRGLLRLNDETYLKIRYKISYGKKLNLDSPKTFNEKLQWLKLNDRKEFYSQLVDKYEVKRIVEKKIGKEFIIPTIGLYNSFDEINFNELPNKFVIKCTHYGGSEGVFIIKDKESFNYKTVQRKLKRILRKNLYYSGREWPYKNVKPRIIIEKYLEDKNIGEIRDYKFYCFNGKVKLWFICSDRKSKVKYTFFDREGNFLNIKQCNEDYDEKVKKPNNLNKMIELAEILSKDLIHVRVDFYEINNKIYFGELTFYDASGFGQFDPEEWDRKIGDMLELPINKAMKGE